MDSASPATKAVARMVLLDGRFERLPAVVDEGRRAISNIERVSLVFLSKTVYATVISVVTGVLLLAFPFLPRQLSALDGLTIGLPAFFLALQPGGQRYAPGFLRRALAFAVPAGICTALCVLAVSAYGQLWGGHSLESAQSAATAPATTALAEPAGGGVAAGASCPVGASPSTKTSSSRPVLTSKMKPRAAS